MRTRKSEVPPPKISPRSSSTFLSTLRSIERVCVRAAIKAAARTQPNSSAAINMRAYRGCTGKLSIRRPTVVISPSESNAPRSRRSVSARTRAWDSGGSIQRKARKSPTPAAFRLKRVSARSRRLISESSRRGLLEWSRSVHRRTQSPGAVRPARPARWDADAALIFSMRRVLIPRFGSYRATRARPESITNVTPSIVSEVSATLVETIIFRPCEGFTARSCSATGSSPCRGRIAHWLPRLP